MAKDDTQNYTNKHNVQKKGDKWEVTVTRYFDDMERGVQWAESTYTNEPFKDGEPAASDMTPQDAEKLNSNVNQAPIPAGAEQVLSGGSSSNDGTSEGAPTPDEAADQLAVDNTAAGTHDPDLNTDTTQVPTTTTPAPSTASPTSSQN